MGRSMRALRPRRQRWRNARRGLVSVVATLFGLLLVVAVISIFVLQPLQAQQQNSEDQHLLQLENQVGFLRSAIQLEGQQGVVPISNTAPIALGSSGVPPFGSRSASTLQLQAAGASTQNGFSVTQVVPLNITWSPSFPTCNNCKFQYYNISTNNTNGQTISARGTAGNAIIINLLGQNNSNVVFDLRGQANYAYLVVGGSNNSVIVTARGVGNCNNESILMYGQNNLVDMSQLGVCGTVNVIIVTSSSTKPQVCPSWNPLLQLTNKVYFPAGSTNGTIGVNETRWVQGTGVSIPQHWEKAADGFWFRNQTNTGSPGCAFTKSTTRSYSLSNTASILIHLANRYAAPADVAFEQGAVIAKQAGGAPVMIDPPLIGISPYTPTGFTGTMTMIAFVGNATAISGTGLAGITTRPIAIYHLSMGVGPQPFFFGGFRFAITTAYPQAWASYFAANQAAFPSANVYCTAQGSGASTSCNASPPLGGLTIIHATMDVQAIQFTFEVVQVSFA